MSPPRLTLPQLQAMIAEAITDRRYQQETRLGAAVARYLAWKSLGASARSLEIYEGYLARLCVTLAAIDPAPDEVTEDMLTAALAEYPPGSRQLVRTAYRGFFKWVARREHFADPAAELPTLREPSMKVYDVFTATEQAQLLKGTDRLQLPWVNRFRVGLVIDTGMRKEEARLSQPSDVDPVAKVIVVRGKGGKERIVPFSDQTWRAYIQYRNRPLPRVKQQDERGPFKDDRAPLETDFFWFPYGATKTGLVTWTDPSRPLSPRAMHHWWEKVIVPAAGIKYRSLHMARHSAGTDLATAGAGLDVVQDWLGHADPKTTKVYVHNSRARLARGRNLLDQYREGGKSA